MSTASAIISEFGKSARERSGAKFPQIGETNFRVINAIKDMYVEASVILGRWLSVPGNEVSDKTAKRKLNFERRLDVEELGILIRSERGYQIVAAIMGDAKPKWWRLMVPLMDAAEAREMQIAARRRLEKTIESAVDAYGHLTTTIQTAEALQDQDFIRPQLDALRSMGRAPNSPVAKGRTK